MRGHLIRNKKSILESNKNNTNIIDLNSKYPSIEPIIIDKEITVFNFLTISQIYAQNPNSTLILIATKTNRKLIIKNNHNILFKTTNINTFDKLIIPELLKNYVSNNPKINTETIIDKDYKSLYEVNKNLYFLEFNYQILEEYINYLKKISQKELQHLNINENYQKEEHIEEPKQLNYSYGYINILLIAFILSIITIVVCLIKS